MSKQIKNPSAYIDKDRAVQLLEKWAPVLDFHSDRTAPINDEHTRLNTAILMENQERWCLNEANVAGGPNSAFGSAATGAYGGSPSSDWYASNDARLPKVLIPMVRRTFPELITNEIVGVQPMSGPVGLAFALRYRYVKDSLGADGRDGHVSGSTTINGWDRTPVDQKELGYQYLDTRFTGTTSAFLTGGSAFPFIDREKGVAALLSQFEQTGNIPQITIEFSKTAVEAGTRRLAATWSIELEQDLKNMNGIDVDSELTNAMSYEIQAEIDREMILRMIQVCINAGAGPGYSYWYAASADARWLGERNRDFYSKIIVEANRIAIRNRRGSANFIIATPRVAAILEMLPEFQWMPVSGNVNTQPTGIAKVGVLGGRFTVYRDTRTEASTAGYLDGDPSRSPSSVEYALLGYKGAEYYETGIVYCPYIPVMIQRTIGPNDFSPRVGLMTRYGVVDYIFGASLFYHLILVSGLGIEFSPSSGRLYL